MWFKHHYIPDRSAAHDFLHSLGMDDFDIQDFSALLFQEDEDLIDWKMEAKEWERDSVAQFEKRNGLITELYDIVDDLIAGKGTKKKIAERISSLCEYYYQLKNNTLQLLI